MIAYLYCGKCSRGFAATLRNDEGAPQDHRYELIASDLKRTDYGRQYVGCAFEECNGSLDDFLWWKDVLARAKEQGLIWPTEPIYGVKYQLQK
jgi:hypothetical protein